MNSGSHPAEMAPPPMCSTAEYAYVRSLSVYCALCKCSALSIYIVYGAECEFACASIFRVSCVCVCVCSGVIAVQMRTHLQITSTTQRGSDFQFHIGRLHTMPPSQNKARTTFCKQRNFQHKKLQHPTVDSLYDVC